jgi:6-phosphogluconolactonase (cycloisomerase 2 family)
MQRRHFNVGLLGLLGSAAVAKPAWAADPVRPNTAFYAGVGPALYGYSVDATARVLVLKHGPYATPQPVQATWQNSRTGHLYIAASDGINGTRHAVLTYVVARDGSLTQMGDPITLAARPIHITVDRKGEYLLMAYPRPSFVTVHRLAASGAIAEEVEQRAKLDTGIYPHEIRVFPSNRRVLVCARGVAPGAEAEQPGSVRLFSFANGQLSNAQTIAPNGGMDFRPRNIEFSPSGRWLYVALEAQNQLLTYAQSGDRLSESPLFKATTLAGAGPTKPGQMLSVIRLHPNGKTLYVMNRASGTTSFNGETIFNDGEESIAVFSLDSATGAPRLAQSIPVAAIGVRGIGITADGQWLFAAGLQAGKKRVADRLESIPQALHLFSIGADGRLTYRSQIEAPSQTDNTVWAGIVSY